MRLVLLAIGLSTCILNFALAEPVPGADDPAFLAPFQRALQGDDPTVLQEIHAAAEAGNEAALRALPTVLNWLPPSGSLAARKRYRTINTVPLDQAVATVSPVAAAWNSGKGIDAGALDKRADTLTAAGEFGKAAQLYLAWFAQSGFDPPVSPQSIRTQLPVFLLAERIASRLRHVNDPADDLSLQALLREDRFEGWLAAATLNRAANKNVAHLKRIAKVIATAGISVPVAKAKMQDALRIRDWFFEMPDKKDPGLAAPVAELLRGTPDFAPIEAMCQAICPETAPACEAAWLAAFAATSVPNESLVPEVALISTQEFFATPRGKSLLFPGILDFYQKAGALDKLLGTASQLDACLVTAAQASLADK